MIVGSCCSEPSLGSAWSDQDVARAVSGSARFAMNVYMIGRRCRDTCIKQEENSERCNKMVKSGLDCINKQSM